MVHLSASWVAGNLRKLHNWQVLAVVAGIPFFQAHLNNRARRSAADRFPLIH